MASITPAALAAVLRGKGDGEMAYVRIEEPAGATYEGRVMDLFTNRYDESRSVMTINSIMGDEIGRVPVAWITALDVRPFLRYTKGAVPMPVVRQHP